LRTSRIVAISLFLLSPEEAIAVKGAQYISVEEREEGRIF
jgi:hypothetical protein